MNKTALFILIPALLVISLPREGNAEINNAYLAPVPTSAPNRSRNTFHVSMPYESGKDLTHYGLFMGCQWGKRTAFLLDWGIAPGDLSVKDESTGEKSRYYGFGGHFGMGLRFVLIGDKHSDITTGRDNFGLALTAKAFASGGLWNENLGIQGGGAVGATADFAWSPFKKFDVNWLAFAEYNGLYGDLSQPQDEAKLELFLLRFGAGARVAFSDNNRSAILLSTSALWGSSSGVSTVLGSVGVVW